MTTATISANRTTARARRTIRTPRRVVSRAVRRRRAALAAGLVVMALAGGAGGVPITARLFDIVLTAAVIAGVWALAREIRRPATVGAAIRAGVVDAPIVPVARMRTARVVRPLPAHLADVA